MSVVDIRGLDDHDPAYVGHVERAVPRPDIDDGDGGVTPRGDCPADAPASCGAYFCCPEGLSCTSGSTNRERYCANKADGMLGSPCDLVTDATCGEGLVCRAVGAHGPVIAPAICTRACGSPDDCAGMGDGYCCILGSCQWVDTECRAGMATVFNGIGREEPPREEER